MSLSFWNYREGEFHGPVRVSNVHGCVARVHLAPVPVGGGPPLATSPNGLDRRRGAVGSVQAARG
jgi:hypothetical protein